MKKEVPGNNKAVPSRRKFLKSVTRGAFATTGALTLSTGCQLEEASSQWSSNYDWVCVGGGMAGCAAAIAGHDKGLKTLLLEKEEQVGGTTAQSGGIVWVPTNSLMTDAGISDSRDEALAYLNYVGAGYSRREYREAFVDNATRVFDYLVQKADFRFRIGGSEFYFPVSPGSKQRGRLLIPEPFPAADLGEWRSKVQNSVFVRGFAEALDGKDSVSAENYGPYRSNEWAIALWRKKLGSEKVDAILKKDEATRIGGAALIAYAVRAMLKRGIEIQTGTSLERLLTEGDRVVGVTVIQNGKQRNIRAMKGVLLAMGGDVNGRGGHGDTFAVAADVGGSLHSISVIAPMITLPGPGEIFPGGAPFGRANTEPGFSHSVVVNRFGERFGDESFFQAFGAKMKEFETMGEHRFRNFPCYLVFDQNLLEKHSFIGLPPGNTEHLDWLAKGNTIDEIARKLKIPPAALQSTVTRFSEFARKGKDLDFNRKPNTMGPIDKAPFYGVELSGPDPFNGETKVVVNVKGQVVRAKGQEPIPGLYACGATTAGTHIWGIGYQAGHSLMSGATFGFTAAEHAAQG